MEKQNNNVIVGLGNLLLTDDTIGPLMITYLQNDPQINELKCFDFKANYSGGIDLLEDICGYEKVFVIDCIETDKYECGTCLEFDIENLKHVTYDRFVNTHGLNLPTIFELGQRLGLEVPKMCKIIGIVGSNCQDFSENISTELESKSDQIFTHIKERIIKWSGEYNKEI